MKELKIKLMERMLGAKLTAHLGDEDGKEAPAGQSNRRNGPLTRVLKGQDGEMPVAVPRGRDSGFAPEPAKKGQTRIDGMDDTRSPRGRPDGPGYPGPSARSSMA